MEEGNLLPLLVIESRFLAQSMLTELFGLLCVCVKEEVTVVNREWRKATVVTLLNMLPCVILTL